MTALKDLHGEQGVAAQLNDVRVKYLNPETGIVFLRARRGPHLMVKDAIESLLRVGNIPAAVKIIHISGTMRSSQKRLLEHHRRHLLKSLGSARTEQARNKVRLAMQGLLSPSGSNELSMDVEQK
ncbi:hypothetical protein RvY_15768 [Ramazzottius varieornatus]|uniref:Ribonuclease P/MRP protein subunit POP5 n=1 Tax=Ramazzottius varieornatus TaxID=947166 RepID=A0A1D1W2T0_RAMVA|nr:hypothetical protein RvY_15768 [Ramazzottius varieornatus]